MKNLKKLRPVPLGQVRIRDRFWDTYENLVRSVVVPYQWEALNDRVEGAEPSHAIANFRIAAGLEKGGFGGMVFQDSDAAKWLEAVGYLLQTKPDPALERTADEVIDLLCKAQRPDGYLNTYFQVKEPGKEWSNLQECHELYCAGHLMEAAVAYYDATGKRKFLDVMCRYADLIDSKFGREPGKLRGYPGHEEIELALVKLYRATGREKYLNLSRYFIDERGAEPYYYEIEKAKRGGTTHWNGFIVDRGYAQTQAPVREQTALEGHAVRGVYLLSGMADVAAETGDLTLLEACRRLWRSVVSRRMYVTGGLGSSAYNEGFTFDYDLPNDTVYAETCASVGLIFLAHRMLQIDADGAYADVLEQALYNTVLGSMSQDGRRFFYVNPLEVLPEASEKDPNKRHVKAERQKWFACACCPPNLARLIASLGQYVYSVSDGVADGALYAHLYIGGEAEVSLGGRKISVTQQTGYPWNGSVSFRLKMDGAASFSFRPRIPGWCRRYAVRVNGETVQAPAPERGYLCIDRLWKDGDEIALTLEMPATRVYCNPRVRENVGKVAVRQGPVVYCLEQADNGDDLQRILLPKGAALASSYRADLLGGVNVITAQGERRADEWGDALYLDDPRPVYEPKALTFVPYFAWGNRGAGEMSVWVREK